MVECQKYGLFFHNNCIFQIQALKLRQNCFKLVKSSDEMVMDDMENQCGDDTKDYNDNYNFLSSQILAIMRLVTITETNIIVLIALTFYCRIKEMIWLKTRQIDFKEIF